MNDTAFLQSSTGYQTSPSFSIALLARLPPIRIILRNNVQNFAALESQSSFFTGNIGIIVRIVFEVCPHSDFTLSAAQFVLGWHNLEGDRSLGVLLEVNEWQVMAFDGKCNLLSTYEDQQNICRSLPLHIYSIYFDDFITNMNQPRSICCSSVHYSGNNNLSSFLVGFYCGSLQGKGTESTLWLVGDRERKVYNC